MSISDAEFAQWLERDSARHCVLAELDHVLDVVSGGIHTPTTATKYASTLGYVTGPSDSPPSAAYPDVIRDVPSYTRALDQKTLGGRGTVSYGQLVLDNPDGAYDEWLNLACDGSELRFYIGDPTWSRADFRHVFTATTERVDAPDQNTISVSMRDPMALLNASIAQEFIGGTGPNAERAKPVNIGYCHQVECLLEDAPTLRYRYGTESALVSGTVRDRGLAVLYTDNVDGTFTLSASPAGIITCDVLTRGPASQYQASDLIAKLVSAFTPLSYPAQYAGNITPDTFPGPASTLFGPGDFELGVRVEAKSNVLDVLDQMVFSAIAFYTFTRDAKFAYGRIWPYIAANFSVSVMSFTADDIRGDVGLTHGDPTYYSWYFFYNKNWHVMSEGDFAGAVSTADKARFSAKGVYASNRPSRPGIEGVLSPDYYDQPSPYHKTLAVSPETETLLSITDADDALLPDYPLGTRWFRRMRNIFFPWWDFVAITVGLRAFTLELGAVVTLILNRYGWDQGAKFQVISINLRLVDQAVDLILFGQRAADVLPPFVHRGVGLAEGTSIVVGIGSPSSVGRAAGTSTVLGVGADASGGGAGNTYTFEGGGPDSYGNGLIGSASYVTDNGDTTFTLAVGAAAQIPQDIEVPFQGNALPLAFPTGAVRTAPTEAKIRLADTSLIAQPSTFTAIDYSTSPSSVVGFSYATAAYAGNPAATVTITPGVDFYASYDYASAVVCFAASICANSGIIAGSVNQAILLITVQNKSGATITNVHDGFGGYIQINLPTNAVNPDSPAAGEFDISFRGGTTAVLAVHNTALGTTVGVIGNRHQLQLKIDTANIANGDIAQFVFPIDINVGSSFNSGNLFTCFLTAFTTRVGTTPSAAVRLFGDGQYNVQAL